MSGCMDYGRLQDPLILSPHFKNTHSLSPAPVVCIVLLSNQFLENGEKELPMKFLTAYTMSGWASRNLLGPKVNERFSSRAQTNGRWGGGGSAQI